MLYSLNFVKIMGIFCNLFAAYINKPEILTVFLNQIAGILLLLSTTINFWNLSKVSVLTVFKT